MGLATPIRVGSRGSPLALRQAELVAGRLRSLATPARVEIVPIRTSGDSTQVFGPGTRQVALADFGGKGLFVRELEEALLDGRVDLAVHSLKDLPATLPSGLCLAAFPPREDPRDVLVSRSGGGISELPRGAVVGTSSLRRRVLLLAQRPDLRVEPIRGNVDTRLRKLEEGPYAAIVLAAAGLRRLGLDPPNAHVLPPEVFVPAAGQGILVVEARSGDGRLLELLSGLDHTETRWQAQAERSFLQHLGVGCHTPVAAHARFLGDELSLVGLVASVDGDRVIRAELGGAPETAEVLGQKLAEELKARGATGLLAGTDRSER
ncbi:MAG: hydroxymethylbilane synthase [Candidatus Rokubacteria bacterium]|nr:hydroxymethylbilane synthase [Candidatus Rokubacteria bacterium]